MSLMPCGRPGHQAPTDGPSVQAWLQAVASGFHWAASHLSLLSSSSGHSSGSSSETNFLWETQEHVAPDNTAPRLHSRHANLSTTVR